MYLFSSLLGLGGTVITALVMLGLAVFAFLQRGKDPRLSPLFIVAGGLVFYAVAIVVGGTLGTVFDFFGYSYGPVADLQRVVTKLGSMLGIAVVIAGFIATLSKVATPPE